MSLKHTKGENIFNVFNIAVLLSIMILTLYPLYHIIMASFSQSSVYISHRGLMLYPVGTPTLFSYRAVLQNKSILSGYTNTIFIVVVGVAINILMTSLGAYFLSRKNVLWRNLVMVMIVFTMYFSGGLIPLYFTVRSVGLYDSLFSQIFPTAINTTNLIIMLTAFNAVPASLEESAKIDGANHFLILFRIIIPVTLATIAVMVLYYAVGHWNSWFNAMIFIRTREKFPLQLILREVLILGSTESMTIGSDVGNIAFAQETIKNAIVIVATLPILFLYPFLQRFFVKGVMIGSIKG